MFADPADRMMADALETILGGRRESGLDSIGRQAMWHDLARGGWLAFFDSALSDTDGANPVAALLGGEVLGRNLAPLQVLIGAGFVAPLLRRLPPSSPVRTIVSDWMSDGHAVAIARPVIAETARPGTAGEGSYTSAAALHARLHGRQYVLDGNVTEVIISDARHAILPIGLPGGGVGVAAVDLAAQGISQHLVNTVVEQVRCGELQLLGATVPEEAVCVEDVSDAIHLAGLTWSLLLDAYAVGVCRALIARSVEYAQMRVQFGRPIGEFQAVQHMAANMQVAAETSASLSLAAMREFIDAPETSFELIAASRLHSAASAQWTSELAIQMHGGVGFTWELGVHEWYRQAMFARHFLTDNRGLRSRLASIIRLRAAPAADGTMTARMLEAIHE